MADGDVVDAFRVASDERNVLPSAERVVAAARVRGFVGPDAAPLKVAVVELLLNAMEHGNGFDPNRSVGVVVRQEGCELCVRISDEGQGVDVKELAKDLGDVEVGAPRGRGLGMVRRLLGASPEVEPEGGAVSIRFGKERFTDGSSREQ